MQSCNLIYPRFSSCKCEILLNSYCSQECLHFIFKCIYIAAVSKCQIIASLNPINCDPVCSIAIPPHSFKTSLSAYYILSRIFNPIINHITECKSHFAKTPPIISSIESVSLLWSLLWCDPYATFSDVYWITMLTRRMWSPTIIIQQRASGFGQSGAQNIADE